MTLAERFSVLGRRSEAIVRTRAKNLGIGAAVAAASMVLLWYVLSRIFAKAVEVVATSIMGAAQAAMEKAAEKGGTPPADLHEPLLIPGAWLLALVLVAFLILLVSVPLSVVAVATASRRPSPREWLLQAVRLLPRAAARSAIVFAPVWLVVFMLLVTVAGPLPMSLLTSLQPLTSPLVQFPIGVVMCGAWVLSAVTLARHRTANWLPTDLLPMVRTRPIEVGALTMLTAMLLGPMLGMITKRLGKLVEGAVGAGGGGRSLEFAGIGLFAVVLALLLAMVVIPWVALVDQHPSFPLEPEEEGALDAIDEQGRPMVRPPADLVSAEVAAAAAAEANHRALASQYVQPQTPQEQAAHMAAAEQAAAEAASAAHLPAISEVAGATQAAVQPGASQPEAAHQPQQSQQPQVDPGSASQAPLDPAPAGPRTRVDLAASLAPGMETGWWMWIAAAGQIGIQLVWAGDAPPALDVAGADGTWHTPVVLHGDIQRRSFQVPAGGWWYVRIAPGGAGGVGVRLLFDLPAQSQVAETGDAAGAADPGAAAA